jgi:hypothetical protein
VPLRIGGHRIRAPTVVLSRVVRQGLAGLLLGGGLGKQARGFSPHRYVESRYFLSSNSTSPPADSMKRQGDGATRIRHSSKHPRLQELS